MDDRKYAAAKSMATGVVSFILTAAMYLPLAKHLERLGGKPVEKLGKAAVKALQDPKFPKFGTKAYDSFTYLVNYGSKLIVAPLDALALFAMIPIIINKVFPHKKKSQNADNYIPSANLNLDKEKKDLFKDFIPATAKSAGDVKSKITEEVKQPKKGLSSGMKQALGWSAVAVAAILGRGAYITRKSGGNFLNNCSKETILSSIYNSGPVKKIVEWSLKELPHAPGEEVKTNLSLIKKHLPAALGVWISGFYIQNTIQSKGIPEERKMPLVINTAFSGVVGTLMGYTITGAVEKFAGALTQRFDDILASNPEKEILKKGFKSIVPLVSFTFAFRYLCPVLATPVADLINKYLIKHKMIKDPNEKQKEETKS